MENKIYIISEECKDRYFYHDLAIEDSAMECLMHNVLNVIAMSTQYEELSEMYEFGVMKKTIILENPTEVMRGVDPKYTKAANILSFLLDKSPKDMEEDAQKLVYENAVIIPSPGIINDCMHWDAAEISKEAYKKIRQSLGFYKQSEIDELQQNDNK